MTKRPLHAPEPPLWHLRAYDRQLTPAGQRYWWNHSRSPAGGAVIQLSLAGHIQYRDAKHRLDISPGTFLLFNYGHDCDYGDPEPLAEPYRCHWMSIFGAGVVEHIESLIDRHGPVLPVGLDHPLAEEHDRLITLAEDDSDPVEMARSIHHFVMNLHEWAELRISEQLAPVEAAVQSILRRPHQPQSLKEIAAEFGVSREHLSRVFRQNVGRPAHEVLAQAKCQRALSLLKQTGLSLAEVARLAGYANPHSLARHVRNVTGFSPTTYRKHG